MNKYGSGFKTRTWFMAALVSASMAGCGDGIFGGGGGGGSGPGPAGPAPVLGAAAGFGVAATTGVTNTPTLPITTINGNVVLDPVAGAICNSVAVDASGGFGLCGGSPPTINGTVISALFDPGVTRAAVVADLQAAFLSITPPAGPPAAGSRGGATNIPADPQQSRALHVHCRGQVCPITV